MRFQNFVFAFLLMAPIYTLRYRGSSEIFISANLASDQVNPRVSPLKNGSFVIVWTSRNVSCAPSEECPGTEDGSNSGVFAKVFDSNGCNITSAFQVNVYTNLFQGEASCASFSGGNSFVIAWMSLGQEESDFDIYMRIFTSDGSVITPEIRVNTYTFSNQAFPALAALYSGSMFVISWQSGYNYPNIVPDGSGLEIYAKVFYANGTNSSSEFRVNDYIGLDQFDSRVSMAESFFVVTWISGNTSCAPDIICPGTQDGSNLGVYARVFNLN